MKSFKTGLGLAIIFLFLLLNVIDISQSAPRSTGSIDQWNPSNCYKQLSMPCFVQGQRAAINAISSGSVRYYHLGFSENNQSLASVLTEYNVHENFVGCEIDEREFYDGYNDAVRAEYKIV